MCMGQAGGNTHCMHAAPLTILQTLAMATLALVHAHGWSCTGTEAAPTEWRIHQHLWLENTEHSGVMPIMPLSSKAAMIFWTAASAGTEAAEGGWPAQQLHIHQAHVRGSAGGAALQGIPRLHHAPDHHRRHCPPARARLLWQCCWPHLSYPGLCYRYLLHLTAANSMHMSGPCCTAEFTRSSWQYWES